MAAVAAYTWRVRCPRDCIVISRPATRRIESRIDSISGSGPHPWALLIHVLKGIEMRNIFVALAAALLILVVCSEAEAQCANCPGGVCYARPAKARPATVRYAMPQAAKPALCSCCYGCPCPTQGRTRQCEYNACQEYAKPKFAASCGSCSNAGRGGLLAEGRQRRQERRAARRGG